MSCWIADISTKSILLQHRYINRIYFLFLFCFILFFFSYIQSILFFKGISTLVKDFKDNDRFLILLRPVAEILQSIQSLTNELIVTAKTDVELLTILKELNGIKRINSESYAIPDDFKRKTIVDIKDELASTNL